MLLKIADKRLRFSCIIAQKENRERSSSVGGTLESQDESAWDGQALNMCTRDCLLSAPSRRDSADAPGSVQYILRRRLFQSLWEQTHSFFSAFPFSHPILSLLFFSFIFPFHTFNPATKSENFCMFFSAH